MQSGIQMKMDRKRKEKLGDVIIDVCKYTLTAVFVASWFKDKTNDWPWYIHISIAVGILVIILLSLKLYKDENKKDKKK